MTRHPGRGPGRDAPEPADTRERDRQERRERVLRHGRSPFVRGIADALAIKDEDLSFLCIAEGGVPLGGEHGLGVCLHDCRFLHGYDLRVGDQPPAAIVARPRARRSPGWTILAAPT